MRLLPDSKTVIQAAFMKQQKDTRKENDKLTLLLSYRSSE